MFPEPTTATEWAQLTGAETESKPESGSAEKQHKPNLWERFGPKKKNNKTHFKYLALQSLDVTPNGTQPGDPIDVASLTENPSR
jgi:hypothetical protein